MKEQLYTLGLVHRPVSVPNCHPYKAMVWGGRKGGEGGGTIGEKKERALEVAGDLPMYP